MAVAGAGRVLLAACSVERWCAWSMRHRGQAFGHCFFLLDVLKLTVPFFMGTPPVVSRKCHAMPCQAKQAKPSQAKPNC